MNAPYKYRLRPAYGSSKLLLEFIFDRSDSEFMIDLIKTLEDINLKIESIENLWMNDEILLNVDSDHGKFILSKDVWDMVFIISDENQSGILLLDQILNKSSLFQKEEVDFSDYKIKS